MDDIFVGRLMSTEVQTVDPETPVEEAAAMLLDNRISSLVAVDDDNQLLGIITSTDFVRLVAEGNPEAVTTVGDHMSREVATVSAQDDVQTAADRLLTYNVHHLPVVDDTEGVIGMLSTTDLTSYLSGVEAPVA